MEREDKENEVGCVIGLGNGVGWSFGEPKASGAERGRLGTRNKRIIPRDLRAKPARARDSSSLAAADIDHTQPRHRTDCRQQRIELRFRAEIGGRRRAKGGVICCGMAIARLKVRRA